jgi:hypothetical protein
MILVMLLAGAYGAPVDFEVETRRAVLMAALQLQSDCAEILQIEEAPRVSPELVPKGLYLRDLPSVRFAARFDCEELDIGAVAAHFAEEWNRLPTVDAHFRVVVERGSTSLRMFEVRRPDGSWQPAESLLDAPLVIAAGEHDAHALGARLKEALETHAGAKVYLGMMGREPWGGPVTLAHPSATAREILDSLLYVSGFRYDVLYDESSGVWTIPWRDPARPAR